MFCRLKSKNRWEFYFFLKEPLENSIFKLIQIMSAWWLVLLLSWYPDWLQNISKIQKSAFVIFCNYNSCTTIGFLYWKIPIIFAGLGVKFCSGLSRDFLEWKCWKKIKLILVTKQICHTTRMISRDVLFEYHQAVVPCWAVRPYRSLSTFQ